MSASTSFWKANHQNRRVGAWACMPLGQWRAEATKPCRLWDGGSVSGRIKSLAAWLAPQAAKFPDSYGHIVM